MKKISIAVLALLMAATFAVADDHGHPGGPGGGPGPGRGFEGDAHLNVAADGTVIVTRAAASSTTANPVSEVVAIRNGAIAWSATLPSPHAGVEISGSQVIEVIDSTATGATTPTTTLTALSISNGAQAWTLNITGRVANLTPFSGGTYAVVIVPATTTGGTATRNLVAISSSGTVLSTVAF
jgi:outer membrane protein assembly factor BamB